MNGSKHSFYGTQTAPIKQNAENKSRSGNASILLSKGSKQGGTSTQQSKSKKTSQLPPTSNKMNGSKKLAKINT